MRNDKGTTSLEVDALGRPQALREQPTRVPKSIARESVSILMDSRRTNRKPRGIRAVDPAFRIDIVACPSRERKPAGGPGPDRADARGGTPVGPAQTAIVSDFTAYRAARAGFCRVAVEVCRVAVKLCRAIKSYPVEFLSSSCRVPVEFLSSFLVSSRTCRGQGSTTNLYFNMGCALIMSQYFLCKPSGFLAMIARDGLGVGGCPVPTAIGRFRIPQNMINYKDVLPASRQGGRTDAPDPLIPIGREPPRDCAARGKLHSP